ncbi:hypothetical protein PVK06_034256 [Gossypium arboreum]|uniref:Uncharacterized protein n=1 Tax=Gossypium arboreum TaxID=29729 RepID=A0ABR0NE16_GOSAR|nr:hypothetical protein PVK06_034256 [Gossypium arboreum]
MHAKVETKQQKQTFISNESPRTFPRSCFSPHNVIGSHQGGRHTPHTTPAASGAPRRYYQPADTHHSEAVADCIEFIKKKSSREENRVSGASSCTSEVVMAVPVMI